MKKSEVPWKTVCRRILEVAAERGIPSTDLARVAGVSEKQAYFVRQERAKLRESTIAKFARGLGTSIEYLTTGEGARAVVREERAVYETGNEKSKAMTLAVCLKVIAEQLGVSEEEVRARIADLLRGGRP